MLQFRSAHGAILAWRQSAGAPEPATARPRRGWYVLARGRGRVHVPAWRAGAASPAVSHTSTGALAAQDAAIVGTAIRYVLHASTGALASLNATMSGSASGPGPDDVSGDTIVALRSISHNTHRRM